MQLTVRRCHVLTIGWISRSCRRHRRLLHLRGVLPPGSSNASATPDTDTQCYLKCISFNARSIVNKLSEFQLLLSSDKPDIVCIVETFLASDITDATVIGDNNYSV